MNLGVRILSTILKPWPRSWIRSLGRPLGWLWFDILRFRRDIVLDNLTKAFPDWSEDKKLSVGRKSVYNMTENFFELFLIPAIDEKWLEKNVVFEGLEHFDKDKYGKRGALLLSLHL